MSEWIRQPSSLCFCHFSLSDSLLPLVSAFVFVPLYCYLCFSLFPFPFNPFITVYGLSPTPLIISRIPLNPSPFALAVVLFGLLSVSFRSLIFLYRSPRKSAYGWSHFLPELDIDLKKKTKQTKKIKKQNRSGWTWITAGRRDSLNH